MRPFRKYPNGGELPEVTLTASRANWEKQKKLRKELAKIQQDYNNLIGDYGLTADDQAQLGFQDYQGGMGSVEELQAKINKLNESYKNTQDQFASANRALADLRTAYPDEWNNKTVSDVISSEGLGAMRRLYSENKLNSLQFKDYYENYGKSVDPFVIGGYSAKKAKENWMEDVPEFTNMVNKGVQFGLGLAGAGALGAGTTGLLRGTSSLIGRAVPYATAPLTVGSRVYPYLNPMTLAGLGFGAHSAANLADPESASRQSLSKAYENPTAENILDATGNVTMDALGVLTSPGMGNMLLQGAKGIANTPKAIGNLYEDVSTGNSLLTDLGVPAWKLEKPLRAPKSSEYIVKNYTDDQIKILDKYGKGMKDLTPEEWQKLEELRKSGVTDFSRGDYPISRIIDYYAPSSAENKTIQALERGDVFTTPTDKSIRTWSAGIPEAGPRFEGKTRLVIPRRYTKNLGNEFAGMPYYDKRSQFIWDPEFGLNTNAVKEKELIGNIPEGFKVIGKSKEGGINNLIIKPITSPNPKTTFGGPFMMMGPNTPLGRILFKTKLGPSGNVTHTLIDDASKAVSETEKVAKTVDNTFAPIVGSKVPEGVNPRTINFNRSVYQDAERASEWLQYPKSTPEILRNYIEGSRTGEIPAAWERVMQNYANVTGNKQALNDYLLGRSPLRPPRFTAPPEPPPAPPVNIGSYSNIRQSNNFINLRRNNIINQNPVYNTLDNLIIDPVKGTIKNSSSASAVNKLKDKISQITNTVANKLSSINKSIGNYIDNNTVLNKPQSITIKDIYEQVNKALETGVGVKKAKNVKIKLEENTYGGTNVLIDIKPYLLENEEKIRKTIPELEQMYPGQSFDEIFADGWINTGTLSTQQVELTKDNARTLTQILKGAPSPKAEYTIGLSDDIKFGGLKKGSEFPYSYANRILNNNRSSIPDQILKDKIFKNLGISGEYNKAINQTVKNLNQRLYSGGTGHYEDGAQRYIKEFLNGRVEIANPKEAKKFLELLNDEKTLGEVNKVLLNKDKTLKLNDMNNPLTKDVYNAIQNVVFRYKKFGGPLYPNRYKSGGSLAPNLPTYYNFRDTPIYRDTTALPFVSGGMLNTPLKKQFKYGSNLYERQGLIPSMYASSLSRYYNNGGNIDYSMYDVFQHGTYPNGGSLNYIPINNNYYGNGGYTVRRSNDRKGKTHVVTGPDGTKKYFGDPTMGERSKSEHGKEAFYARHKHNLANNPYFRAYAKATWANGGFLNSYKNGGKFLTAGGEYHRIYKNAEGDIMVNHPTENKGQWDTINLTDKANAHTIAQGVNATKQWHAEHPNNYANGGLIKRADGSYSQRGLWDNIRANKGSGKKPTAEMLAQERKINNQKANGGYLSSFKVSNIQTY